MTSGGKRPLKVLVTSGPTREYLDRIRFITNPSTGIMGDAFAVEAKARGHDVVLVRGPSPVDPPEGIQVVSVETTEDMRRACVDVFPAVDAVVMAAAPVDYKPSERHPGKMKKVAIGQKLIVTFVRTPDILAELGERKIEGRQRLIGFAVEVENGEQEALSKLERKRLDFVVLNDPSSFGTELSSAVLYGREGKLVELKTLSKRAIARAVIERLEALF